MSSPDEREERGWPQTFREGYFLVLGMLVGFVLAFVVAIVVAHA